MSVALAPPGRSVGVRGLGLATRRSAVTIVVGICSVWAVALAIGLIADPRSFAFDFRGDLYDAARAILHGHSPYQQSYIDLQAAIKRAGGNPDTFFSKPVFLPPVQLAAVPLCLLPFGVAAGLFVGFSALAIPAALWLLGVRDWRCYGIACVSYPVVTGVLTGTLTPLLVLGIALAWRYREGMWSPALAVAAAVLAKLFLWPLGVWLAVTRRRRALLAAVALGASGTLAAWGLIGFAGLTSYPSMAANVSLISEGAGISLTGALLAAGFPLELARAGTVLAACALLAMIWRVARRPDGDRRAFGLAVMTALVGFPVVWEHFVVLALVPIALLSPGLSALWLVPLLGWLAAYAHTDGALLKMLPYLAIEAIVIWRLWAPVPSEPR